MGKAQQKQLHLYADLMEEMKVRFNCINHAAQGGTRLPPLIVREFLYQQLRFLCELIALSCLVAHGDIAELKSHKIGRAYSADEILDRMTALRPHFYPVPVRETGMTMLSPGRNHINLKGAPSPLPKDDLVALYRKTHKHLHRGSLKAILSASTPVGIPDINEIIAQAQKMSDLMAHHLIAISERELIICLLINPQNKNKVQVLTAQRAELDLQVNPSASPDEST
jgi:hypothetical protein